MCCEDFLVVFCFLLLTVERSKELYFILHGVVGPLRFGMDEERVAYETRVFEVLGEQHLQPHGEWGLFVGSNQFDWDFDSTRGFPGEDIDNKPALITKTKSLVPHNL